MLVQRGRAEAERCRDRLLALGADTIVVADAAAWFSRLVDGLERLAHALHPERVPEPPGGVTRMG